MIGKLLLLLAACVAYVACDGHDCEMDLDMCNNNFMMVPDPGEMRALEDYRECLWNAECSMSPNGQMRKDRMLEEVHRLMQWDHGKEANTASPSSPLALIPLTVGLLAAWFYNRP